MDRTAKKEVVAQLREELEGVPSVVVATNAGVDANTMNDLRAKLREVGAKYRIVKNTLARLAVADTPLENVADHFVGPTAIVYHPDDAVAGAKVLVKFAEDVDALEVRGGWLTGDVLDNAGVVALSKMPGKDELRAKLLICMNAAPTNLVRVLAAGPTNFLNVLNARKDTL